MFTKEDDEILVIFTEYEVELIGAESVEPTTNGQMTMADAQTTIAGQATTDGQNVQSLYYDGGIISWRYKVLHYPS